MLYLTLHHLRGCSKQIKLGQSHFPYSPFQILSTSNFDHFPHPLSFRFIPLLFTSLYSLIPSLYITSIHLSLLFSPPFKLMGFSKNLQDDMGFEFDPKKWVITGIQLRPPLIPINTTNPIHKEHDHSDTEDQPPTPTADDCRIRSGSKCPPAPKKPKSSLKFNHGNVRQFFKPPDLEVVFSRHVERAN